MTEQHDGFIVQDRRGTADGPEPKQYRVTKVALEGGGIEMVARDATGKIVDYIRTDRDGRVVETRESEAMGFPECPGCGGTHARFSGDAPPTRQDCPQLGASWTLPVAQQRDRRDIETAMETYNPHMLARRDIIGDLARLIRYEGA